MKVDIDTQTTVVITLTEEEASWLKSFIQNSHNLQAEDVESIKIRKALFDHLKEGGIR